MYLEGSDQHRGWFHSSLLESCGTRWRAPFDVVLTHGFILDEKGEEKMSKSRGNTLSPQDLMQTSGADILRLWVASSDYANDIRFGRAILQGTGEAYRKLRNTLRWMLGTLAHYEGRQQLSPAAMPELEQVMLHRLTELDAVVREAYAEYDYKRVVAVLSHFMNTDLSAFYFDIRKDALYCEPYSSAKRRAALETIEQIFRHATLWLAPLLCFTAEEAWLARYPSEDGSVHLEVFPEVPKSWRNEALAEDWETIKRVRRVVTGALGDRAGEQADRLLAGGVAAGLHCGARAPGRARGRRLRRGVHHLGHRGDRGRAAAGRLHPARRARRRRRVAEGNGEEVRALLAVHRRRGQRPGLPGPLRPRRRGRARVRGAGRRGALTGAAPLTRACDTIRVLHEQDRKSKCEAYSWRLSPELKTQLEAAARDEKASIDAILDRLVREWLKARALRRERTMRSEQRRLRALRVMATVGPPHGRWPSARTSASEGDGRIPGSKHRASQRRAPRRVWLIPVPCWRWLIGASVAPAVPRPTTA